MPQYGDLVLVLTPRGKRRLIKLEEGKDLHTGEGIVRIADIVQQAFGSEVLSSLGIPFRLQKPTMYDLMRGIKRQTQIIYPKDISYICMRLGVGPGRTIIEAGSGSGGLTLALSWFSGPTGCVHTFEAREEFHKLAKKNLAWAGLGDNVNFHHQDIETGFGDVTGADALFLDVRTPWEYLHHIPKAVCGGAALGFLLPTGDQVNKLLLGLEKGPFDDIDVLELMLRHWKNTPDRLRPDDRMIAHTGFLVFARHQECSELWESSRILGTRERKQEKARRERLGLPPLEQTAVMEEE